MWCIIIPILVGIISALLGYLLGRLPKNNNEEDTKDDSAINLYKNRISILQADLEACLSSNVPETGSGGSSGAGNGSVDSTMMATNIAAINVKKSKITPFNSDNAKTAFGKQIKENDLTVIEGIGPKILELFHNQNIKTWAGLANCTIEKCQSVLNSGGERFKIHNPGTWPKQSKLASEGQWEGLKKWQDQLDGGK